MSSTVLCAMSGGVDSSVCAKLLADRGFDIIGATMLLHEYAPGDAADAAGICKSLGAEHLTLELGDLFRAEVIEPFISAYEHGETPNPCIECNRHLKFGRLLEEAGRLGCDYIATGHYARISYDEASGRYLLKKALHPVKDQSYVLYRLTQHQLAHTLFPLGELTKDEVRAAAEAAGFSNAHKGDSQDICFIPDGDYSAFIRSFTGRRYPEGAFLGTDGKVLGRHSGIINYTIGQRRGLGIALGERAYVCGIDASANTVTLGRNEDLFTDRVRIDRLNLISVPDITEPIRAEVKLRYSHRPQPATVTRTDDDLAEIVFDAPQRAVTPGQSAVIYQGDTVVGGGYILGD